MKIEFLYFEGCPNSKKTLELLKQVLEENGINEPINVIEVNSEADAEKYKFLGSPSIHINGKDIEKGRENDPHFYGCRIYRTDAGVSGQPSKKLIEEGIDNDE